jgi:hypothetical protein
LANVAYTYFTSLPRIENEHDLHRVAMASNGRISMQTTSTRVQEEMLELKVYRGNTEGRTAALEFWLPSALAAPGHLYLHPAGVEPAWYEVVGPEIIRVGVEPGESVHFAGDRLVRRPHRPKSFEYVVLGDASQIEGLAAPYEEEDTLHLMHLERLNDGLDFFNFWQLHANSDQVSLRIPEMRLLKP